MKEEGVCLVKMSVEGEEMRLVSIERDLKKGSRDRRWNLLEALRLCARGIEPSLPTSNFLQFFNLINSNASNTNQAFARFVIL